MSFLGKQPQYSTPARGSFQKPFQKRKPRHSSQNATQKQAPTTESLRTLFLTHLPPSFTNTNSVFTAQERINNLIAKYIGPNNVQNVKIIGEGRAKVVFKMALWAKQVKNAMQGVKLRNDPEWVEQQKRAQKQNQQDEEAYNLERDFRGLDRNAPNDFNQKVQDIVPLTKDHFGDVSKLPQNRKISTIREPVKPSKKETDLAEQEYTMKVVDHEEKQAKAQEQFRNRDVVVKGISKDLTLKEAEKKLTTYLSAIGIVTNIRIPAKHGSIQEHTGYAFVSFQRPKHAEMAIELKNGREFEGRKLLIEPKLNRIEYLKQKEEQEEVETLRKADEEAEKAEAPEMTTEEKQQELDKAARIQKLKSKISTIKEAPKKDDAMEDDSSSDDDSSSSSSEEDSVQGFATDSDDDNNDTADAKRKKDAQKLLKKIPTADVVTTNNSDKYKAQLTPEERSEIDRTVFVRNIPVGASEEDVTMLFSTFGIVEDCKLVRNRRTGVPSGTGFVLYQNSKSFKKLFSSVKLADTMSLMEKKADDRMSLYEFKQSIKKLPEKAQKRRLKEYLRETSMQKRKEIEEKEGKNFWTSDELQIDGAQLYVARAVPKQQARDKMITEELEKAKDKRNLHLAIEGFVPRNSPAALGVPEKLLLKLEQKHIEKQNNLKINPSLHVSTKRLKVSYIPKSWDYKKVEKVFADAVKKETNKFPMIHQVLILKDDKGKSKGMGFVEFEKHEHALTALRELNNNPNVYTGGRLYIEFAIDDHKKLHNMRFKREQQEAQSGAVTHNRIQKIYSKVENTEVRERIERVMQTSRPAQAYKRKREREERQSGKGKFSQNKRRRTD